MNSREVLDQIADEWDLDLLVADGFDEAILGIVESKGSAPKVLYDREKCIEILVREGMSWEEAEEYFEFNVADAYVGEATPAFLVMRTTEPRRL